MDDDPIRRKAIATDSKARWVFALLLLLPVVLGILFVRQERRLRALADHGRATSATVTLVTRDGTAHYRYEVEGTVHTWNVARRELALPAGESFSITYLPEDPSLSRPGEYTRERLDKELGTPIRTALPIGLFAFLGGAALLCHRNVVRLRAGAPLRTGRRLSPDTMGLIVAGLMLACVLGVNFDPKVRAVQAAAFGVMPFGLPLTLLVNVGGLLLFAPFFWVFPHLMRIVFERLRKGGSVSKLGIVVALATAGPELRRSRNIVVAGFVYFAVIVAAWIAFAAYRGV